MNVHDPEVAERIRERCKVGIAGPPLRTYRKPPVKYRGPIHQIRPDNAVNTDEQQQSLFMNRLPYDVRLMVYAEILRPMCIIKLRHFTRSYRGHSRCNRIRSESCYNNHSAHAWNGFSDHCPTLATQCHNSFLNLFLTCRRVHFEAMHVLYSRTPFVLFDISGLQTFTTQTPSRYLNIITSLSLTWLVFPPLYLRDPSARTLYGKKYNPSPTEQAWSVLCIRLAQMPRLAKIHITIHNLELTGLQLLEPLIEAFGSSDEEHLQSSIQKRKLNPIPDDFKVFIHYSGPLPAHWSDPSLTSDSTSISDPQKIRLPFRIHLLSDTEAWKSAPGAKIWPPRPYRDPTTWNRLDEKAGRMCAAVGAGMMGVWRGMSELGRGR